MKKFLLLLLLPAAIKLTGIDLNTDRVKEIVTIPVEERL